MQKDVGFRYSSLNKIQKDIRYSIIMDLCTLRFKTFTPANFKRDRYNDSTYSESWKKLSCQKGVEIFLPGQKKQRN